MHTRASMDWVTMDIREAILTDDSGATTTDTTMDTTPATMATAPATMAFPEPLVLMEASGIRLVDTIK